ncbi:restriction endonuclease subunit S [Auritidibacter ignavus]|uniref:restriction endonuclease subunit S n=1 Tax=Auritidibacter ignavus TaxID=678932 RepID=UPI0024486861|nr:restriction endonuclease subunit S [Auritidibacter ignavus]WGH85735.1 restriction endonuclease subunit S [Auritidibacter ignavus]WGH88022.1 restriction endonuclease subunit S [Auritidibacter ignavus]
MSRVTLGEAFVLNPTVKLSKGTHAPFVDMASLVPFTRDVSAAQEKPYGGGMKFCDGDVLMARITPSLENGKTSVYRAAANQRNAPAFGSTEFIVIRGKEGISSTSFAYYLFTSPEIRDYAIGSMNGSSGRQRVQFDSLASFEIDLPELQEQRSIAATLGALDDKIESNRRAINSIFKIVTAMLSSGAEKIRIGDIATVTKGLSYKGAGLDDGTGAGALPMLNLASFTTTGELKSAGTKWYTGAFKPQHVLSPWEVVLANTDLTQARELLGRGFLVPPHYEGALHTHHTSVVRFFERSELSLLLWAQLQSANFRDRAKRFATGTTVAALPPEAVLDFELAVPDDLDERLNRARLMIEKAWQLERENETLTATRDELLPELLSGRIRAADVGVDE